MKILLIDVDDLRFEILNEVASLSNSEVIKIPDIQQAKDYISSNRDFHAVIAIPKIGNIPTIQILAMMKKNPDLKDIPFIIIAEEPTGEEIEYYKTIGVTEVFEIPFNPLEVFLVITNYIRDTKGEKEVKAMLQEENTKEKVSIFYKIMQFIKRVFGKKG